MRRAVFLDRDGVIKRSMVRAGRPYAPTRIEEFEILPGVADCLLKLRDAGFVNIVVTNQPDLATGKQSRVVLEAMHERLRTELAIDAIRICGHTDADRCACRKPLPGMILDAAGEWEIDLAQSWMVGDRWRDIAAGQAAGCRCCFIDYGYDEKCPEPPYSTVQSLDQAVVVILQGIETSSEGG